MKWALTSSHFSEEKEKEPAFENKGEPLTLTETPEAFCLGNEFLHYEFGKKKGISLNWSATGKPLSQRLWNGMFTGLPRTMTEIL